MLQSDIASIAKSKYIYFEEALAIRNELTTAKLSLDRRSDLCALLLECERMIQGYNSVLNQQQVNAR